MICGIQECIGGGVQSKFFVFCCGDEIVFFGVGDFKWFFSEDMFVSQQCLYGNIMVGGGYGEVQDEVDILSCDQVFN